MTTQIFLLGPAGSGKSSLTGKLADWLSSKGGYITASINLDPGCEFLPYRADYDVRSHFTLTEIMQNEKLGPNGAMIKASELIKERLKKDMETFYSGKTPDFTIIDTPGQSEIFVFRETGPQIAEALQSLCPTIGIYVVDPYVLDKPTSIASVLSLSSAITLKLTMPLITVLNKIDLLSDKRFLRTISDMDLLSKELKGQGEGAITDLALGLIEAVKFSAFPQRIIGVSAKTGEGFDEMMDMVNESFCECGDLT